ncbi:MAG: C25 family cysteine peptidase [Candidatus Thermoplasmatota archaeon]|nr:C25 family cysteine peptidase [Candidatus Thermoplasmatota archaeon]
MTRKAIISVFVLVLLVLGSTVYVRGDAVRSSNIILGFSPPVITDSGKYVTISMENMLSSPSLSGYPIMPYKTKVLTFPFGTKIENIDVEVGNIQTMHLDKKIAPAPEPVPLNGAVPKAAKEGSVYESNEPYPPNWFTYNIGAGIQNGEHAIFLSIHAFPARYIPSTNELEYVNEMSIEINYIPPEKPMLNNDAYDLLIVSPSEFSNALQPLVEHKENYGVTTKLVTLNEVYSSEGRDKPEKIKYFIKNAIEQWGIDYVMLVGSADKLPVRLSYTYDGEEDNFPSDLYYADIYDSGGHFSPWDTNNNNLFGEYQYQGKTDDMDLYPDVYIGRLACDNAAGVSTIVNKIIYYESNTFGKEWFTRAVLCGGDSHNDNGGIYEGEYTKKQALSYLDDFTITKLYASLENLDGKSIRKEINDGAGFVDFSGHGNRYSWATHPPGEFSKWIGIDMSDVSLLSNANEYPIIVLDACSTGDFEHGNCLAWHFVKSSDKGAIATFATTALSWGYIGSSCTIGLSGYMDVHLTKHFSKMERAGEILANSIEDYLNHHSEMDKHDYKTIEEFELFGDPSLATGGRGCSINKPRSGHLYLFNKEVMPTLFGGTFIIGKIGIEAAVSSDITKVEFYVDDKLRYAAENEPYEWFWDEKGLGKHSLKIVGYEESGGAVENSMDVLIFNI